MIVDLSALGSRKVKKHVLAMYWLWNDGSQDRSGIQLVWFRVQRLGVQVFPALPQSMTVMERETGSAHANLG